MSRKPTCTNLSVLAQVCNLIPAYLVPKLAREHDIPSRSFSPWSHIVALLYTHLAHALSLNDVCDSLKNHKNKLSRIRHAVVPRKNTLSYANRNRNADMAQDLFWKLYEHLTHQSPRFGGRTFKGMPRRFKRAIYAMDSSTIRLVANCIDWAKHRRQKAAAKLHLVLNIQNFLPSIAVVDTAKHNDNRRARELCAKLKAGEIVVFDKAYVDFEHLFDLNEREVFWVCRPKENFNYRVKKKSLKKPEDKILRDDKIVPSLKSTREKYPQALRRVRAIIEINGQEHEMDFITNNFEWAASSIADLYACRWSIEVFFKEIKQTLQLGDFLGYNKNAICWQVWTALTLYLLLRFIAFVNSWNNGFKRLFCLLRSSIWDSFQLSSLLRFCGTAGGQPLPRGTPEQLYFPGFSLNSI